MVADQWSYSLKLHYSRFMIKCMNIMKAFFLVLIITCAQIDTINLSEGHYCFKNLPVISQNMIKYTLLGNLTE